MKLILWLSMVALVFLLAGCASAKLPIGRYETQLNGREDFAVVYEDLIFISIKSPEDAPGKLGYWSWAGKYRVSDNGELEFDMDKEARKRWGFYFTFLNNRNGITVNDLSNNTGFLLQYRKPVLRGGIIGPTPTDSGGIDPLYKNFR